MDLRSVMFLVVVALSQFVANTNTHDCLLATNGNRALPNFTRAGGGLRFRDQPIQAIITSYKFNCYGVITQWGAFVHNEDNDYYTITFQVWRPNSPLPVENDGCYAMIGSNHFPNIVLDSDRVVRETPLASERIEFQPGDVIGFYLIGIDDDNNGMQFADDEDNAVPYTEETVWFATSTIIPGSNPSCQFPVGVGRTLSLSTNLAPLITAAASMSDCPRSTSVSVMSTTSTLQFSHTPTPTPSTTRTVHTELVVTESSITTEVQSTTEPGNISIYTHISSTILEMLTTSTPPPSPTSTLTPSYTPPSGASATEIINIESTIPTSSQGTIVPSPIVNSPVITGPAVSNNTGLIAGIAIPVFVVGLILVLVIVMLLIWRTKKRRLQQTHETQTDVYSTLNRPSNQINRPEQEAFYDTLDSNTTILTSNNEAYGKLKTANPTTEIPHSNLDPLTSQNVAYGDISGQSSFSRITGSLDDTSIPTTVNEYTSVSTNTERVDTEGDYTMVL